MKGFVNPLQMGLLGGIAAWGSQMDKFNMLNAQTAAMDSRYKARYDAMSQVQAERAKNNALLGQMKLEANQRTFTAPRNNADGTLDTVTYRNVYNPSTQQYEPQEIGHVPYQPKGGGAAGFNLSPGQTRYDAQGNPVASLPAKPDMTGAREDAIGRRAAARSAAQDTRADALRQKDLSGKAEAATNADMKEFHKATSEEQAALLKEAGIDPSVFNSDDPKAVKPKYSAAEQYRATMLDQHKKELGIGDHPASAESAGGTAPAPGAQPQFTPDGRQIKYDASGNPFIKGPDGKPTPYVADANGNPDSPLAMDTVDMSDEDAQPTGDEQEQPPTGSGLIAGNAAPDDEEAEPTPDDEEEEPQGLMSGQYA